MSVAKSMFNQQNPINKNTKATRPGNHRHINNDNPMPHPISYDPNLENQCSGPKVVITERKIHSDPKHTIHLVKLIPNKEIYKLQCYKNKSCICFISLYTLFCCPYIPFYKQGIKNMEEIHQSKIDFKI